VRRRRKLDDAVIQGSLESPQVTDVIYLESEGLYP
jgi:hypothetical protein